MQPAHEQIAVQPGTTKSQLVVAKTVPNWPILGRNRLVLYRNRMVLHKVSPECRQPRLRFWIGEISTMIAGDMVWQKRKLIEGGNMKKLILAAAASLLMTASAYAEVIKIGVVGPFSGPFAIQGKNFKAGIDAYLAEHGNKVGENTIEILYRDVPQPDPAQSKALAQELVVKEGVQYLAGFYFTPDAMAVTPLLKQGNVPMVIMNAATSAIVTKSPLVVRTSFTTWQTSAPMAKTARERGVEKAITVVSDYGPGVDAETAFKTTFEKEGGTVVESIRMPLSTNDFSPIMQRVTRFRCAGGLCLPAVRADHARFRQGL